MRPDPIRVAIDLETTGLRPEQDVIIEIGAVKFAGVRILDTFQSFVSISTPLPYRIQRLTGITSANLRRAPQLSALIAPLRAFIGTAPLVGHSVAFDASFLRRVGLAQRNPLLDTYELAAALLPDLPSYTLASVAEALAVPSSVNHRALADADLARGVLLALLERLSALDTTALHQLAALPAPADWTPAPLLRAEVREREESVKSSPFAVLLAAATPTPDLDAGIDPAVTSMALALPEPDAPAKPAVASEETPAANDTSERGAALADWMR
ncbi:MAG: 3'-5' exonuclease, partial [Chloroflexota bacterium]|nr:3'-5' exonuclease [Chloroflexota bacterium]